MARPVRIPRRTAEIELWDVNPVGTHEAWRRELLQFWAQMLTRGRRVRAPAWLMVWDGALGQNRAMTVDELASRLSTRIAKAPGAMISDERRRHLERWLGDAVIVPGERRGRRLAPPAAGVATPHYLGLLLFNRGATRERFWASFYYSALATDLLARDATGRDDLAGSMLDNFLAFGLDPRADPSGGVRWTVDFHELSRREPETLLVARGVTTEQPDGLGSASTGLPAQFFATSTEGASYTQFLCPGSVILMRRSLRLLLQRREGIGHAALAEMIEASLAAHGAVYFLRGMRVLNDLEENRRLPDDCAACYRRFQRDLVPGGEEQRARWAEGDYWAAADAADAAFVEDVCRADDAIFLNAGRKELTSARDLGRLSLEDLRRKLASYTVNRILLKVSTDVARRIAKTTGREEPGIVQVPGLLDTWSEGDGTRLALSMAWDEKIEELSLDPDVPGPVLQDLEAQRQAAAGNPRALEDLAKNLISEAILSSRAFTRYIELLHSLLGGGSLPSNEDPKGFMARGGSRQVPFHLALNDKALEHLVAVAYLEANEQRRPLSFQDFIDFLRVRYHLLLDQAPASLAVTTGLVADATTQSREALRRRLSAMGMLEEYSDSSEWNRVSWRVQR